MKRLVLVFSLALLIGLFALPGSVMISYGAGNSGDQGEVTVPDSNQEQVKTPKANKKATKKHHHKRYNHDYDRPYVRHYDGYYNGYYGPYYNDYYYPRSYYYGPGIAVDTPFFGIRIP